MRDLVRTKWAAVGAAIAVTLGAGGVSLTQAAISSGEKPVYVALAEPCRLVDTRPASTIGPKNTPIAAGDAGVYEIQVTGDNGNCTGGLAVPADAVAVATNVTAIAPVATTTGRSFFTVYPGDAARPTTSNLNFLNGAPPTPNKVDVGLSATGTIKIYNNEGSAHAAVDVFGYYIDHNHDDRYYTEGEVDATIETVNARLLALESAAPLYAHVLGTPTPTISRGSGAVSVTYASLGDFIVTFDRDVSDCAYAGITGEAESGTPSDGSTINVSPSAGDPNGVFVEVFDAGGGELDEDFYVIVIC